MSPANLASQPYERCLGIANRCKLEVFRFGFVTMNLPSTIESLLELSQQQYDRAIEAIDRLIQSDAALPRQRHNLTLARNPLVTHHKRAAN
jgi:hypothetical protein